MAILVNSATGVLVQGLSGAEGRFHAERMLEYGTKVVGGVTPGRGGEEVLGLPMFNSVEEARRATGANASIIFVPAAMAADAVMEASAAGIELVVCITEHIPVLDMSLVKLYLRERGTTLIGPNCPGLITPGACKLGIMPANIHTPGAVGVVSRSGTLTYEAVDQLTRRGVGQSTCVGIGGDPIIGLNFTDVVERFTADPQTEAIVMIGEIGGTAEQDAAAWIKEHCAKPVFAFIAGQSAPPGRRMGHAGAIVSGKADSSEEKIAALRAAGIVCVERLADMGRIVAERLGK